MNETTSNTKSQKSGNGSRKKAQKYKTKVREKEPSPTTAPQNLAIGKNEPNQTSSSSPISTPSEPTSRTGENTGSGILKGVSNASRRSLFCSTCNRQFQSEIVFIAHMEAHGDQANIHTVLASNEEESTAIVVPTSPHKQEVESHKSHKQHKKREKERSPPPTTQNGSTTQKDHTSKPNPKSMKKWSVKSSSDEEESSKESRKSSSTTSKSLQTETHASQVALTDSSSTPSTPERRDGEEETVKNKSTSIDKPTQSKMNASAPEFIPLGNSKPKQQQRRAFSESFEATLQPDIKEQKKKYLPPWLRTKKVNASKLSLHDEIKHFVEYISPTKEEKLMREDVIQRISDVIIDIWPESQVKIFGSFTTELFLPYSDIDLVVLNAPPLGTLQTLGDALESRGMSRNIQLISSARVPIIKMTDAYSGCTVDISFNVPSGPENTKVVSQYVKEFPLLRPLILVIKYFLQQRALNEPYSGGIGSYTLLIMIVSFLQLHMINKRIRYKEEDIGVLLTDFFELYGLKFNYYRTGISIRDGGSYFSKEDRGWTVSNRPYTLAVEDPHDIENNVGRNSFAVISVRNSFAHAYHTLLSDTLDYAPTRLSRILTIDETMDQYREFIKSLYSDYRGNSEKSRDHTKPFVDENGDYVTPKKSLIPKQPTTLENDYISPGGERKRNRDSSDDKDTGICSSRLNSNEKKQRTPRIPSPPRIPGW